MNSARSAWALLLTALAAMLAATPARACFIRSPQPVQVWLDHIRVDVTDQVAEKHYTCTFLNPNPQAVVGGTCYMELEPGAQVSKMSVTVDGKEMTAEILDVEKANQVFAEMVKEGGSPALLEYYGNQLIQTQVPKIAPNGTVTVELSYTMALKRRGDLVRMQMLNTNPKALLQPLKSASVTVNIKSSEPLKNVYSPTHKIELVESEDWDVTAKWSQEEYLPKHPFVLYYQTSDEPVAASLLAHRELDEPGAFLLMLSPTVGSGTGQIPEMEILPKDVVFCVDTSGSMLEGGKMDQARGALKYCLENLRPGDRFNIVDFSTQARSFHSEGLVELDDDSRARALRYAEKLAPRGGTAISEALDLSLKHLKEASGDRLKMIVFATDGLPTIGERDPEAILRQVAKENTEGVRIFVFGEGFDVNTKLLDFLALRHRGEADYILPEENITEKIGRFFDRVGSPVLTDLEVTFEGLEVEDVYPSKLPDVFRGEQVMLTGRYKGYGTKEVVVRGKGRDGQTREFRYTLEFPEVSDDDRHAFVPRLWAGQKVDFLLNELRDQGDKPEKELVEEVTELALRYGIVTPYTSFLVADDTLATGTPNGTAPGAAAFFGAAGREEGAERLLRQVQSEAAAAPAADEPADQRDRVLAAKESAQARYSLGGSGGVAAYDDLADAQMRRGGRPDSSLTAVRYIGSRTFYKRGDDWYDSVYDPEKHKDLPEIEVGSEEYLDLLKEHPGAAKYLALGDVVVEVKGRWYHIRSRRG